MRNKKRIRKLIGKESKNVMITFEIIAFDLNLNRFLCADNIVIALLYQGNKANCVVLWIGC